MTTILLHGLGQTPHSWDGVRTCLPVDADVRCPDLLGWISEGAADYDALYGAFCAYCDGLPGQLQLCGLSLGAELALQYAIQHPQRVGALVVIAAQYRSPKALLAIQNLLFRLMPQSAFQSTGLEKQDFMALCRSMMNLDFSNDLGRITCPTLVLCGQQDRANQKASQVLFQRIGGSTLQFIPQAGHQVNLDNPKVLAQLLGSFFTL